MKCEGGKTPLEYYGGRTRFKRILPMLLRFGAPLPRSSHARWMGQLPAHRYDRKMTRYVARVAAAGSWAAYERQHRADLARRQKAFFNPEPNTLPVVLANSMLVGFYSLV